MFKKKSIEIDFLISNKPPTQKTKASSTVLSVKNRLKNFAIEETNQNKNDDNSPNFLEEENEENILFTEKEKNIYSWLDENNIIMANPKEKIYLYFQKNKDKILFSKKQRKNGDFGENKVESKSFLNFSNSPLLMRRDKNNFLSQNFENNLNK